MSDINDRVDQLQALAAKRDRLTVDLAMAQNAAANGRWFCVLLALINLASAHTGIAVLACFPIGLSVIADTFPHSRLRIVPELAAYALASAVAIVSLINAW